MKTKFLIIAAAAALPFASAQVVLPMKSRHSVMRICAHNPPG